MSAMVASSSVKTTSGGSGIGGAHPPELRRIAAPTTLQREDRFSICPDRSSACPHPTWGGVHPACGRFARRKRRIDRKHDSLGSQHGVAKQEHRIPEHGARRDHAVVPEVLAGSALELRHARSSGDLVQSVQPEWKPLAHVAQHDSSAQGTRRRRHSSGGARRGAMSPRRIPTGPRPWSSQRNASYICIGGVRG